MLAFIAGKLCALGKTNDNPTQGAIEMPIQIHSHQLNKRQTTGILITWKGGVMTCIEKTPATMDMIVYEFDDIEEITFIDMVVYDGNNQENSKRGDQ